MRKILIICLVSLSYCGEAEKPKEIQEAISKCRAENHFNKHYCELKLECIQFQKNDQCDAKLRTLYKEEALRLIREARSEIYGRNLLRSKELGEYSVLYVKNGGKYCSSWDDEEETCDHISRMPTLEEQAEAYDSDTRSLESDITMLTWAISDCETDFNCKSYLLE